MNSHRKFAIAASFMIFGNGLLIAHEMTTHPAKPASVEFNQVKLLAGKWSGTELPAGKDEKPSPVTTEFKVTSAGSAIEETLMPGTPQEMVDMYTDDGGKLAMTHYCAIGNQPHMRLKKSSPAAITLEMGPSAGIDAAKDMHMHTLALEFPDANHLVERWTNYMDGKPGETVVFKFTRSAS